VRFQPGTRVGHYEVGRLLGVGGMGEVYQARDTTLDRDVAIKVLHETVTRDADRLARLEREAKLLAALNHPGIAGVHSPSTAPTPSWKFFTTAASGTGLGLYIAREICDANNASLEYVEQPSGADDGVVAEAAHVGAQRQS